MTSHSQVHLGVRKEDTMEMDFLDDIGEGAYHSDAENRKVKEEMPEERWEKEFDQMDGEEEVI